MRFVLVEQFCKQCGYSGPLSLFDVSAVLWKEVMGPTQKTYCLPCFLKKAERRGIIVFLKEDSWARTAGNT